MRSMLYRMAAAVMVLLTGPVTAWGQGSIYGTVNNSDMSAPADGEISFIGFLDDTDEEIRIDGCTGADYESGYWFDDFQNYLTEAPGNPYDFYFFNLTNGERYHLTGIIPNNSYERQDVILQTGFGPAAPDSLAATGRDDGAVIVTWQTPPDLTYHVYRRAGSSEGSFFRLDNPDGSLTDQGTTRRFFVDTTVDGTSWYDYVIMAEDSATNYSPPSEILTVNSAASPYCCIGLTGNLRTAPHCDDYDQTVDMGDLTVLIDHLFISLEPLCCLEEGDMDLSGQPDPQPFDVDTGDLVVLIDHLFISLTPLPQCP